MRSMLCIAAGALALGLTACGGDESFRANLRTQALRNCQTGSNPAVASQLAEMGMTVEQLCTCAIDRYMRATPTEQLRGEANTPLPTGLRNASMQCLAERVQRSSGAPGAAPGAPPGMGGTPAIPSAPGAAEAARAVNEADRAVAEAQREAGAAAAEMENAVGR